MDVKFNWESSLAIIKNNVDEYKLCIYLAYIISALWVFVTLFGF